MGGREEIGRVVLAFRYVTDRAVVLCPNDPTDGRGHSPLSQIQVVSYSTKHKQSAITATAHGQAGPERNK